MYKIIYLYILECSDLSFYVGVTNNLHNRINQHNNGSDTSAYTFNRRPIKLVYHTYFTDFDLAFKWETKIKKWSHSKKEALIHGNYDLIKKLSKKNFKKNT